MKEIKMSFIPWLFISLTLIVSSTSCAITELGDLDLNFTDLNAQFDQSAKINNINLSNDSNPGIEAEYRQESFNMEISGPSEANINDPVLFNADIQSRSPIAEYKWIVTNQLGKDRQEFTSSGQTFSFIPRDLMPYFIRLQITNRHGAVRESNILRLDVGAHTASEFTFLAGTNPFATIFSSVAYITDPEINQLPTTEKLQLRFVANNTQGEPAILPEMPILEWRIASTDEFLPFDDVALDAGIRESVTQDPESQHIYYFNVIADSHLLGESDNRWIQFRAYSRTILSVISPNYLEAEFRALDMTQSIEPKNVLL